MQTEYDFAALSEHMVYVKAVALADLPMDVQNQVEGVEELFSVHAADGQQLALVADRSLAFDLARQNDYAPQALH